MFCLDGGKGKARPPQLCYSSVSYWRKWFWQEGRGSTWRQAGIERVKGQRNRKWQCDPLGPLTTLPEPPWPHPSDWESSFHHLLLLVYPHKSRCSWIKLSFSRSRGEGLLTGGAPLSSDPLWDHIKEMIVPNIYKLKEAWDIINPLLVQNGILSFY